MTTDLNIPRAKLMLPRGRTLLLNPFLKAHPHLCVCSYGQSIRYSFLIYFSLPGFQCCFSPDLAPHSRKRTAFSSLTLPLLFDLLQHTDLPLASPVFWTGSVPLAESVLKGEFSQAKSAAFITHHNVL